jgi:hypothetical protein
MKYALLAYDSAVENRDDRPIDAGIAAVLTRPEVVGWLRLRNEESATTVRTDPPRTVFSDGPFIDSKEFLGGVIIVEADNLDGALALAAEFQELRSDGGIEVRPIIEQELGGA